MPCRADVVFPFKLCTPTPAFNSPLLTNGVGSQSRAFLPVNGDSTLSPPLKQPTLSVGGSKIERTWPVRGLGRVNVTSWLGMRPPCAPLLHRNQFFFLKNLFRCPRSILITSEPSARHLILHLSALFCLHSPGSASAGLGLCAAPCTLASRGRLILVLELALRFLQYPMKEVLTMSDHQ